ncbi:hypothetical protein D8X55_02960 [Malacoplasma penetrans]|nr:hypothetical protein D8X55_02960 [Malacoplasma penetrans]
MKFKAKSIEGNIMIRENNPSPDILEEILKQLKTISSDVAQLKTDMVEVKADITQLKKDVSRIMKCPTIVRELAEIN